MLASACRVGILISDMLSCSKFCGTRVVSGVRSERVLWTLLVLLAYVALLKALSESKWWWLAYGAVLLVRSVQIED